MQKAPSNDNEKPQVTPPERQQWHFQSLLPTDATMLLFELIVISCLIAAIVKFIHTGDSSLLSALLTWSGAQVGLTKVKHIIRSEKDQTDLS